MSVRPGRLFPQVAALLAVVGLLAVAAFAATASQVRISEVDRDIASRDRRPTRQPQARPEDQGFDGLATVPVGPIAAVLGVILALAAVAVVLALIRGRRGMGLRRRMRRLPPAASTTPAVDHREVASAVATGLDELASGTDPRAAVIACWTRLEHAAAAAGVPRQPSDTATDLVLRLLRDRQVSEQALQGFAAVYRHARYAPHAVNDQMHTSARDALRRLQADLGYAGAGAGR